MLCSSFPNSTSSTSCSSSVLHHCLPSACQNIYFQALSLRKTHIFLQKSEPIQPKTSNILPKFCQPTLSDVRRQSALSGRTQYRTLPDSSSWKPKLGRSAWGVSAPSDPLCTGSFTARRDPRLRAFQRISKPQIRCLITLGNLLPQFLLCTFCD